MYVLLAEEIRNSGCDFYIFSDLDKYGNAELRLKQMQGRLSMIVPTPMPSSFLDRFVNFSIPS